MDEDFDIIACEFDARVFNQDFDDADKAVFNQQLAEANLSDEDAEMAAKFGY